MTTSQAVRGPVLLIGKDPGAMRLILWQLGELGVDAQGTTELERAAEQYDARRFDLIVFGGGVDTPLSDRLKGRFRRQNPAAGFLHTFAPVAARHIAASLRSSAMVDPAIAASDARVEGSTYLLRASIARAAVLSLRVYRLTPTPTSAMELVEDVPVSPGSFERTLGATHSDEGRMAVLSIGDGEYHIHRLDPP